MEILLLIIFCCIVPLLIIIVFIMDNNENKNEDGFNIHNSSLSVQCDAKEKCDYRFSSSCKTCKHNCGMKQTKSSYEPR